MEALDMNDLQVTDIQERIVAIVKFGPAGFATDGFKMGEYFQVTIDPNKVSPSGEFIRFGTYQGDEILGWQRCSAISVVEILAKWDETEEQPLLEYGNFPGVSMMVAKQAVEIS